MFYVCWVFIIGSTAIAGSFVNNCLGVKLIQERCLRGTVDNSLFICSFLLFFILTSLMPVAMALSGLFILTECKTALFDNYQGIGQRFMDKTNTVHVIPDDVLSQY